MCIVSVCPVLSSQWLLKPSNAFLSQDGYLEKDIGMSCLFRLPVLVNISQILSLELTHFMFSWVNELKDSSGHSKLILIALVVKSP